MAVERTIEKLRLQLRVENGTSATGSVVLKNVNFNQIKETATDDQLYAAGTALASLQTQTLNDIRLLATISLTSDS